MITKVPISANSPWDELNDIAKFELSFFDRAELLRLPLHEYWFEDKFMFIAGLDRTTLLGIPHLMMLLSKNFKGNLRVFRHFGRLLNEVAPVSETVVPMGDEQAEKLARVWKFKPTSQSYTMAGRVYRLHRRAI